MPSPIFLAEFPPYEKYLELGRKGAIAFPEFERDTNGAYIVMPGEGFCRISECDRRKKNQDTRNLRMHVKSHGVEVSPHHTGKPSTIEKAQIRAWYRNLMANYLDSTPAAACDSAPEKSPAPKVPLTPRGRVSKAQARANLKDRGLLTNNDYPCGSCANGGNPSKCPANMDCDYHKLFDMSDCVDYLRSSES